MKQTLSISLILLLSLFTNCDNQDDDQIYVASDIDGAWNLVKITGGEAGLDLDFEEGLIKWNFNAESLIVENNNNSEDYDAYESGNYSVSVLENEEGLFLIFDGREYGKISLSQDEMTIDQNNRSIGVFDDLFILKLKK